MRNPALWVNRQGCFFNTLKFEILKRSTICEFFDLFPCVCMTGLLFRSETDSPQDPAIAFVLESSIKRFQTTSIFERTQVLLLTGTNESHGLSKSLHNQARPASLLSERSRITVDIIEAIFIVLSGKLPVGSIVEIRRSPAVVPPSQATVEKCIPLEHGGHLSVGATKVSRGPDRICVLSDGICQKPFSTCL